MKKVITFGVQIRTKSVQIRIKVMIFVHFVSFPEKKSHKAATVRDFRTVEPVRDLYMFHFAIAISNGTKPRKNVAILRF